MCSRGSAVHDCPRGNRAAERHAERRWRRPRTTRGCAQTQHAMRRRPQCEGYACDAACQEGVCCGRGLRLCGCPGERGGHTPRLRASVRGCFVEDVCTMWATAGLLSEGAGTCTLRCAAGRVPGCAQKVGNASSRSCHHMHVRNSDALGSGFDVQIDFLFLEGRCHACTAPCACVHLLTAARLAIGRSLLALRVLASPRRM